MKKILLSILLLTSIVVAKDTLYCYQGLTTGSNTGADTTNAWQDLQTALDNADSTDVVKVKIFGGCSFTMTVPFDVDAKSGTITSDRIEFIGVNNSWVEDGTIVWFNANDAVTYCLTTMTANYVEFRNIGFKKATVANVNMSTGDNYIFNNCQSDSGVHGWYGTGGSTGNKFINCSMSDNDSNGIYNIGNGTNRFVYCSCNRNGFSGAHPVASDNIFYGCEFIGNLRMAVRSLTYDIYNCVLDGYNVSNDTGLGFVASHYLVVANRITNFNLGYNGSTTRFGYALYNTFYGNADDTSNVQRTRFLTLKGVQTNSFGVGADDGYLDKSAGKHNLKVGAIGKFIPVRLRN